MGSERCQSTSSDMSPSSSSSAVDRMVSMELEAAEALADLAYSATKESDGGGGKWGSKGKRAKKRVKSESLSGADSVPNPVVDLAPTRSDPPSLDGGVAIQDQGGPATCRSILLDPAKAKPDAKLCKPSPSCTRSHHTFGVGRSRQNLSEEEKEARRLHRILANRESARQTIRRRQALCEELTKKAADLACENENLKREKELALKDYQSLELANKHLKAQMAKAIKVEMEESSRDLQLVHDGKFNTPTTNCPDLSNGGHLFSPLCCPSMMQSSNLVQPQHGSQSAVIIPSNIPMPANEKLESSWQSNIPMPAYGKLVSSWQQEESAINVNGPRTPLYVVPCPWFFPVPDHGNGFHPQPSVGINHLQDAQICENSASSKVVASTENLLHMKVKSQATSTREVGLVNNLNEAPVNCSPDEGSDERLLTSLALGSVTPTIAITESGLQSEYNAGSDGSSTKASQMPNDFQHRNCLSYKFQGKQLVDAAVAAEARRKRKELTKLKNLHGRQCKMNC